MKKFFDICPMPEPSSLLGFAGNEINSNTETRTPDCLSAALDNPQTRYLGVCNDRILVDKSGEKPNAFFTEQEIGQFEPNFVNAIIPGEINEKSVVAIPLNAKPEDITAPYETLDARAILYSSTLSRQDAGAIGMALSLMHWHKTNQFCGRCGAASRAQLGGVRRDCSKCQSQIFPRTDPVVIMLAVRGDKCLLGRSPHFPPNWYSCLAGFVEPGETIEQAVRRETMEESRIKIGRVRYYASQPWPFPHSLMIGAYGEALSEEITFQDNELEDCRWFDRNEVLAMVEKRHASELRSPPNKSIASAILRNWLEETA